MERRSDLLPIYLISIFSAMIAWTGLGLLVIYTKPTIGPRWVFFFLSFIAVAATFLPISLLIHQRVTTQAQLSMNTPLRQSILLASFSTLVLWLQMGRVLDFTTASFIFAVLLGIEILVQLFDKSQLRPDHQEGEVNEK
ncbi:MAG: hypothetical protein HPY85_04740 [Anaerolineae bacterium]|nr:hypothetical protein [Anaerolineae bacterium]